MKYGSNVYRSSEERKYYYDECNKIHSWEIINRNGNYIELQCKRCGVLGHAFVRKIR